MKMNYEELKTANATPAAASMVETFRAMGYSLETAMADILDNSISAGANNIWISRIWKGGQSIITIKDDGIGMNHQELIEAMRPGSQNPLEERSKSDLGRFGLGLKTASFSQCRRLTVYSKKADYKPVYWTWDLDYVAKTNQWELLQWIPDEYINALDDVSHGTLVIWSGLDRIINPETSEIDINSKVKFSSLLDNVKRHISMTFHRFIEEKVVRIFWCEHEIEPWNPFCENEPKTQIRPTENIIGGISVKGYVLPHKSAFSSEAAYAKAEGINGWAAQQGFYVYRGKRLLLAGDWLGLFRKEEYYKLVRIKIDLPIGPEKVFGTSMDVEEEEDLLPIVVPISDYLTFIPEGHKKNDPKPTFADIPESLKTAIKSFILTCAIRLARGQENKHNSMLIHVSRYQLWQNEIKELVAQQFSYYKQEIEANDPSVLSEFQDLLENDYTETTNKIKNSTLSNIDHCLQVHQWEDIKPLLFKVVQKIEVKSINGSSGDIVDYQLNSKNGVSVIAIGGDKLSRGLTLEGLSISYFLRASKMYDTLMQMGRWFGYRPGYVDLCRLFTSAELNEWYRHIAIASAELREEFNYLAESRSTPDKYALKVRTHPGCLQITALNKMRNTKEIQVSWASRLIETYQLPIDKGLKNRNLVATDELLAGLGEPIIKDGDYLWKNVPANQICDYFNEFTVAESLKKVNLELIVKYINELQGHNELTNWSVALMNKSAGSGPNKEYRFCNKYKVNCFYRNRAIDTDYKTYFIRKNHIVGNQADEFVDLEKDMLNEALETTKRESVDNGKIWSKAYPKPLVVRSSFRPKTQPLLIIYPLNPIGANVMKNGVPAEGSTVFVESDDPFVGFAISFPATDTSFAVNYKVNMVGEYADIEDNFDNENDNEYRE